MSVSSITHNPAELLNRYADERYPPALSADEHAAARAYLEAYGMEPRIGVVACRLDPTIESLVRIAMSGYGLGQDMSADEVVVGPHSMGMENAISIWAPVKHDMP